MASRTSHSVLLTIFLLALLSVLLPGTVFGQNDGAATCPNSLPPQMVVGENGRLIPGPGLKNRIRQQATTSSDQVGTISEGDVFIVLDGPECADGYAWWQIDFDGVVGWTVQGDSQGYWIEPLISTTSDSAAIDAVAIDAVDFEITELEVEYDQAVGDLIFLNTNMENFPGTLAFNWNSEEMQFHYLGEAVYGGTYKFTGREFTEFDSLGTEMNIVPHLVTFQGTKGDVVGIELINLGEEKRLVIGGIAGPSGGTDYITMPGYERLELGGVDNLRATQISLRETGVFTIRIEGLFYSVVGLSDIPSYTLSLELVEAAQPPTSTPAVVATLDPAMLTDRRPHPELTAEDLAQPLLPVSGEWQQTQTACDGAIQTSTQTLYVLDFGRVILTRLPSRIDMFSNYLRTQEGMYILQSRSRTEWTVRSPDFITYELKTDECTILGYYELLTIDRSAVPEAAPSMPDFQVADQVRFRISTPLLDEAGYASFPVSVLVLPNTVGTILSGPIVNNDPIPGTHWYEVRITNVIGDVTLEDEGWIPASVVNEVVMEVVE